MASSIKLSNGVERLSPIKGRKMPTAMRPRKIPPELLPKANSPARGVLVPMLIPSSCGYSKRQGYNASTSSF